MLTALDDDQSILLVSEPLEPGGIAVYTSSIMNGLSQADVPHWLLTSAPPVPELLSKGEWDRTRVVHGLFWSFWNPFVYRRLARWARQEEVALIHGLSAPTTALCARLAETLDLPFVVTVHTYQQRGAFRIDPRLRGLVAVSESLRENLVNDVRVPKELVRVIPAGIRVPPPPPPREEIVDGAPAHQPLVCTIGRLAERKDVQTFIRAARIVLDRLGRNCSFIICGDGPEEPRLRRMVRELNLQRHVAFCHGNADYSQLLHDTDVYVQCPTVEGFGTMVLQAMAHGVPVVATSTGGIISLVREGETGFLVPVNQPELVAERILRLLNEPELTARMGATAREVALAHFSLDSMMTATFKLYEEALASRKVHA